MIMSKPEWLNMKHSLGFDFPNLPYYEVIMKTEVLLVQSL